MAWPGVFQNDDVGETEGRGEGGMMGAVGEEEPA